MGIIVWCCTTQHLLSAKLALSLVPAGLASTATISTEAGVFRRELMPVVAVGTPNVLVAQSVDASGATSPVSYIGGVLAAPLGGGELFPHSFSATVPGAGSAAASRSIAHRVLGRVLMALGAVGLGCVGVSAVPHPVVGILRRRAPLQILKPVVVPLSVQVPALHPLRTGADESLQDQAVNSPEPTANSDFGVSHDNAVFQYVTLLVSYTSKVADFVKGSRASRGAGLPDFFHSSKCTVLSDSTKGWV